MSDETIRLSFGGGSLKFRVNGNKRLINTYAELAMINASEDDLAYSYLQESALDLLGSEDVTAHGLERRNWLPIGVDYMNSFTGNYDGGKKKYRTCMSTGNRRIISAFSAAAWEPLAIYALYPVW